MTISCNFIIQDVVFENRLNEAKTILEEMGHSVYVIKDASPLTSLSDIPFNAQKPTVGMVSQQIAKRIQSERSDLCPGVYFRPDEFSVAACSKLYGEYMLNSDYVLLPWCEIVRRKEFFETFFKGSSGIYIRPNSAKKIFTGQELLFDDWTYSVKTLERLTGIRPDTLVAVSALKEKITAEWRVWVSHGNAIEWSFYSWDKDAQPETMNVDAISLIQKITEIPRSPDTIFTIDLCMEKGSPKIVEINPFSTSSPYDVKLEAIFEAVALAAFEEWTESTIEGAKMSGIIDQAEHIAT